MVRLRALTLAPLAVTVLAVAPSCGGKVEDADAQPWRDIPVSTPFVTTPPPVRARTAIGEIAAVPEVVAYLGYFRKDPLLARTVGAPCETVPYHLESFEAQVYPWTYGDLRRCVADGVCPQALVTETSKESPEEDDVYVEVDADAATKLCRLHGGEVITNAQLVALAQGGQRRVAWEAFEADVLTRCAVEERRPTCTPYEVPADRTVRRKASEPKEARGPFGHYGLLGDFSLVRQFLDGYKATYTRDGCSGSALPPAMESGVERMARMNSDLAALTIPVGPKGSWELLAAPLSTAGTDRKTGRVRCAFPLKTK